MPGTEDVSLTAVAEALRGAGFEPDRRAAPRPPADGPGSVDGPGSADGPGVAGRARPAVWVAMPGEDAYAVVVVDAAGPGAPARYRVGFHERPYRTRGHPYADPVETVSAARADEVVAAVRHWARWEATWSVTPVTEPAGRRVGRLRRLAASRLASASLPVDVELDRLMLSLLDTGQAAALYTVLDELFLPGIRWRFPRDRTGSRLASRARVLLREFVPPAGRQSRGVWLVVDGPAPGTAPRLTVRLAHTAGRSAAHRWDRFPEYWHTGRRDLDELWGITGTVTAAFVDEVVGALLAGDTLVAVETCGVGVDRGTRRLLSGLPDRFALRAWTDRWVTNATDVAVRSAPWRWRDAPGPRDASRGRVRPQRLETLGGFNPNRRPGLFLHRSAGRPVLTFDQSASPLVLPRACWERDPDLDLVRLGLLTRDQIPVAGRTTRYVR